MLAGMARPGYRRKTEGRSTLVTWVAERDFDHATSEKPDGSFGAPQGPIANLLSPGNPVFQSIRVLHETSDDPNDLSAFKNWVDRRVGAESTVQYRPIEPIEDKKAYSQLFGLVTKEVDAALEEPGVDRVYLNGSSGRPVKHAIFMLIATPRHDRVKLLSAWKSETPPFELELPFQVQVAFARDATAKTLNAVAIGRPVEGTSEAATTDALARIHGSSPGILLAKKKVAKYADKDVPVLILGETGTGKELFAEALHYGSPRSARPFVAVNCGAIPESLIDAELFGSEKGSYTGADIARKGRFQEAHGGTLFLDEIGELPLHVQARLLRALNTSPARVRPLGSEREIATDVRVIAATHRDLPAMVQAGTFREDLFHRLDVAIIELPALRDRGDDTELLVNTLWAEIISGSPSAIANTLSDAAIRRLAEHDWPGNIRALRSTLARISIEAEQPIISVEEVATQIRDIRRRSVSTEILDRPLGDGVLDLPRLVRDVKRHYLDRALTLAGGNKSKAARLVGLKSNVQFNDWAKANGVTADP